MTNSSYDFMSDIIANPKDDAPRLIYADWLMDNGQEKRGELIKVQVELAKLEAIIQKPYPNQLDCSPLSANWCPNCGDCCCKEPEERKDDYNCPLHNHYSRHSDDSSLEQMIGDLHHRECSLLVLYGKDWLPDLTDYKKFRDGPIPILGWINPNLPMQYIYFNRGFIHYWRGSIYTWMEVGKYLAKQAPLEKIDFSDREPHEWYPEADLHDTGSIEGYFWDEMWAGEGTLATISNQINQHNNHMIPIPIFRLLVGGIELCTMQPWKRSIRRAYPNKERAIEALSDAAILWAKQNN